MDRLISFVIFKFNESLVVVISRSNKIFINTFPILQSVGISDKYYINKFYVHRQDRSITRDMVNLHT